MWSIHIINNPYQKVVLIDGDKLYIRWNQEQLWVNPDSNEQKIKVKSWEKEHEFSNRENVS
jgi:hypothetical protein